jgi:hypothetical protein
VLSGSKMLLGSCEHESEFGAVQHPAAQSFRTDAKTAS